MSTTTAEPVSFVIWHRLPGKRQRWYKAGRAATRAGAIALIGGSGDWRIEEQRVTPPVSAPLDAETPTEAH